MHTVNYSRTYLDKCRMEVDVVRYDNSTHNAHSLLQLHRTTALTIWQKHPFQQLALIWLYHHILGD